jgi:hypothetical protein
MNPGADEQLGEGAGLEHRFEVEGRPCIIRTLRTLRTLRIIYKKWHYDSELWVDGRLQ